MAPWLTDERSRKSEVQEEQLRTQLKDLEHQLARRAAERVGEVEYTRSSCLKYNEKRAVTMFFAIYNSLFLCFQNLGLCKHIQ